MIQTRPSTHKSAMIAFARVLPLAAIAAAFTVIVPMTATANEPFFPRQQKTFARLDSNHDGKVERGEFDRVAASRFGRMDTDGDKVITSAEIDQILQKAIDRRKGRLLSLMDRDKNGAISEAELDKIVDSMFIDADSDRDGALNLAEMQGFKRDVWRKRMTDGGTGTDGSAN
jgi:EF hand